MIKVDRADADMGPVADSCADSDAGVNNESCAVRMAGVLRCWLLLYGREKFDVKDPQAIVVQKTREEELQ